MTQLDDILRYYPDYLLRFDPDAYGTHLACLETTSLWVCALASRLSHESWSMSSPECDLALLRGLNQCGDDHAKSLRWKQYAILLTAARYVWQEMNTYTVGWQGLGSTSTMHNEARNLTGDALVAVKDAIPESLLQTRCFSLSYQTARRIIAQRSTHRLPQWHYICQCLTELTQVL